VLGVNVPVKGRAAIYRRASITRHAAIPIVLYGAGPRTILEAKRAQCRRETCGSRTFAPATKVVALGGGGSCLAGGVPLTGAAAPQCTKIAGPSADIGRPIAWRATALIIGISGQDGRLPWRASLLADDYAVHGSSRDAEVTAFHGLARLGNSRQGPAALGFAGSDFHSVAQVIEAGPARRDLQSVRPVPRSGCRSPAGADDREHRQRHV